MSKSRLQEKYGEAALAAGVALQPAGFERRLAQRDRLDQHFTRLWLDFQILGLSRRSVLDTRTRLLVQIGQFTMTRALGLLEDTIRAALNEEVPAREVLEIILQCSIYGGQVAMEPALDVFERIAEELDLIEDIESPQLPLDGTASSRSLEEEEKQWHADDATDPRREDLMERHGWLGVSTGMLLRPKHHLMTLAWQDALDPEWASLWEKFTYEGLYTRGVVDTKTRLLCMVGNCVAIGEMFNGIAHMRGSLRAGASPREVMEVLLQSAANFGMPPALGALRAFVEMMAKDGRLDEIGNPPSRND